MMTTEMLKVRLADWEREYGWGGMPRANTGANVLQQLIEHKGFVPSGRGFIPIPIKTLADEVEAAVMLMQNTPGESPNTFYRAAMVLRVEHLTPSYWPEQERMAKLRRIGLSMSRHTYYRLIQFAHAYLMGHFSQRAVA